MIAILDYGLGNAQAFNDIYHRLGVPARLARSAADLEGATHVVLPGVGAFDWAMARLRASGLVEALDQAVLGRRLPVLGICVGMQILANRSDEGTSAGLGWITGEVRKFPLTSSPGSSRLPHMGWNDVQPSPGHPLFAGMEGSPRFYFLHSYFFLPASPESVASTTDYHGPFASTVSREHIHGVQFHPEKSHEWGVRLLKNFADIQACCVHA